MEALTPIQRIAVIAIGLALTLIVAALALPWISKQIDGTPIPWAPARIPAGPQSAASVPAMPRTSPPAAILCLCNLARETNATLPALL